MHICIYVFIHICIQRYLYTYTYIQYIHTHKYIHIYNYISVYLLICIYSTSVYVFTCVYICTYMYLCVCICRPMYVCIYISIYYISIYLSVSVSISINICVSTYTHIFFLIDLCMCRAFVWNRDLFCPAIIQTRHGSQYRHVTCFLCLSSGCVRWGVTSLQPTQPLNLFFHFKDVRDDILPGQKKQKKQPKTKSQAEPAPLRSPLELLLQLLDSGVHLVLGLPDGLQLLPQHRLLPGQLVHFGNEVIFDNVKSISARRRDGAERARG